MCSGTKCASSVSVLPHYRKTAVKLKKAVCRSLDRRLRDHKAEAGRAAWRPPGPAADGLCGVESTDSYGRIMRIIAVMVIPVIQW